MSTRCSLFHIAVIVLALAVSGSIEAQQVPLPFGGEKAELTDRLSLYAGVLLASYDTNIRVDSDTLGTGTDIDVEALLGLDSNATEFQANLVWRLGKRDYLSIGYLDINRSGRRALDRTIQFGDFVFNVNASVDSFLDTYFIPIVYWHSFTQTATSEFGWSFGVSPSRISAGISAQAQAESGQVAASEEASVNAPVPLVGLYGSWMFTQGFRLTGYVQYISLNVSDVDGSQLSSSLGVDYSFSPKLRVGLAYNYNKIDVDQLSVSDFEGRIIYKFDGLLFYGSYAL